MSSRSFKSTQLLCWKVASPLFCWSSLVVLIRLLLSVVVSPYCVGRVYDKTSRALHEHPSLCPQSAPWGLCLQLAVLSSVGLLRHTHTQTNLFPDSWPQSGRGLWRSHPAGQQHMELSPRALQQPAGEVSLQWTRGCCSGAADTEEVLKGISCRSEVRSVSLYLKISVLSLCRRIIVATMHKSFVHLLDRYRQEGVFLK